MPKPLHEKWKCPTVYLAILLVCSSLMHAQDNGANVFDTSFLHQIHFYSETSEDLWSELSETYVMATMIIDDIVVDSIGVQIKGFTSSVSPQKPLKIDFNRYVTGQEYDGLKKLNLNNNYLDVYMQRESLANELYRRSGLPAPRTSYAEVYVDDDFKGVYTIAEQIDKTFLADRFPSNDGSLYKGVYGGIIPPPILVEVKEGTSEEYQNFVENANAANLHEYLNLRNYLKLLAVDMIIEDWDAYAYERHNFYIYYETKSGLLNYITYDHNFAFDVDQQYDLIYPIGTYPLQDIITDPTIKTLYEETMCELLSYLLDLTVMTDITDNNYAVINSNIHGVTPAAPTSLVQYIINREQELADTLTQWGVTCGSLNYPYAPGDLVINEFVAWSDSIGGVQEPDGGTPDWIEIYNASNSDILLDEHIYLSDDQTFLKKWHFPEPVTLPSNDYLIVWADRDVHQQGVHAGFRLEKSGGSLFITNENLSSIQDIQYSGQELNQGYARVPNGNGPFVIQPHTFNTHNGPLNLHDIGFVPFMIYPNPMRDNFQIDFGEYLKGMNYPRLLLNDQVGRLIEEFSIAGLESHYYFATNSLEAGAYHLTLLDGQTIISSLQLLVE